MEDGNDADRRYESASQPNKEKWDVSTEIGRTGWPLLHVSDKLLRDGRGRINETHEETNTSWWETVLKRWAGRIHQHEDQVFLVLTLLIGGLVGLVVVAFILLTERLGARLYPASGTAWRRFLMPVGGSLGMGYLLYRYFPDARGSGVPQTRAALFAREGRITLGTVLGKFFCTSATLASGPPCRSVPGFPRSWVAGWV